MARLRPFASDRQLLVAIARILFVAASATSGNDENGSGAATDLVCDNGKRQVDLSVTSSTWRNATLRPANQNFSGECQMSISYEADRMKLSGPSLKPALVLLKIRWQRAGTVQVAAECGGSSEYLVVINGISSEKSEKLCECRTYYVWARAPVVIYMMVAYGNVNSHLPFADISFLDISSPTNICDTTNTQVVLRVGSVAFAFAPSSVFSAVSRSNTECSGTMNYTLSIVAESSSDRLNLTVLSAPDQHSGWSLLVNEKSLRDGDSLSSDNGHNLVVFYVYTNNRNSLDEQAGSIVSGFTAVAISLRGAVSTDLSDRNLSGENAAVQSNTKARDLSPYSVVTASTENTKQNEKNVTTHYSPEPFSVVVVSCSAAAGAVVIALVSGLAAMLIARRHGCQCNRRNFQASKGHLGGDVVARATETLPTKTTESCNVASPSEAFVEAICYTNAGQVEGTMIDNELYSTPLGH